MTANYVLSDEADNDLDGIVEYTINAHGVRQMYDYVNDIENAAEDLSQGYGHFKTLREIDTNLRVKICRHHHIFGLMRENQLMLVIAIFHERMKMMKHLKNRLSV